MFITSCFLCAVILATGSSSSPMNETCDALARRCETLQNTLADHNELMGTEWPVADDKANQTAQTEKLICRFMQESAQCLNALHHDCPTQPLHGGNSHFIATWLTFIAKLCDPASPVQTYVPVLDYCYKENTGIIRADIPMLHSQLVYVQQSVNASTARINACRALSDIAAHMNGTAAAIRKKCGEEGLRILLDGAGYLLATNCPN
ncbi:uncharacterized protein LOC129593213 [Paramacrobiotus metropolitanus]|uniref:uncharacterized protein LOC129593213 n=1 Tax=Paramacrobiotus metropolitanus TaxID=2943436 RepID=UPI0024458DF0|nr:uncharacterized protein LOC129593213 [Paramacrobiotus metropolitanus]